MASGGFKVFVNGRVEYCYKIEADFDDASVKINNKPTEDFDRESFVVTTFKCDTLITK